MQNSSTQAILDSQNAVIRQQGEANSKLLAERDKSLDARLKTVELIEELTSEQHLRELETIQAEDAMHNKRAVLAKLGPVAAALAYKLSDGKIDLGVGGNPIMELLKSLSNEQQMKLSGILTPEQQMQVAGLLQEANKEEEVG